MSKNQNNSVIPVKEIPLSLNPNFNFRLVELLSLEFLKKVKIGIMSKKKNFFNILKYSYAKIMNWEQIIGGSAFGAILTESLRFFREQRKHKHLASDSLYKLNEIYSKCMKLVLDETPADRFLIFRAENGGGKIVPGVQLFASVLYEDYRHLNVNIGYTKPIIDKYQRWMCDKGYIEMLMQVCMQGSIRFWAKELPDESKIKNVLEAEGIEYAEMHFIAQRSDKLFYCLISTSEEKVSFELPSHRNDIDISVNRLRNIFKESLKNL